MGKKLLIHNDQVTNIHTLEVYKAHGGYASVEKALKTMTPDQVTDEVKNLACAEEVARVSQPD